MSHGMTDEQKAEHRKAKLAAHRAKLTPAKDATRHDPEIDIALDKLQEQPKAKHK